MRYRADPKTGRELSILGFGCMRLPERGGEIDDALARPLLLRAIEGGVNYFDHGYFYQGGRAERYFGRVIEEEHLRDRVLIADKLPPFLTRKPSDIDRIFEAQKERLRTDRIDYYLMHMLSDLPTWEKLKAFGIEAWIERKKAAGEIGRIGFSFHGGRRAFLELLDAYPWEFCQIQYNYLDEHNQAGREGLLAAAERGLPVIAMEPLRGGRLAARLPLAAEKLLRDGGKTPAAWGLHWVWSHPQITVALSGMGDIGQVEENIQTAAEFRPLGEEDLATVAAAKELIAASTRVPCTGCGYCLPCPAGVDIPTCFSLYNESAQGRVRGVKYLQATGGLSKNPGYASRCNGCGRCEKLCPQGIPIRQKLRETAREIEKFPVPLIAWVAKRFM